MYSIPMNIEVYSVKGFAGNLLKNKLEEALELNKLAFPVSLINDVDQFIELGLSSVPAVRVGTKIIEHPTNRALDDMVKTAMELILEDEEESILVPIDFTPESIHGLRFAQTMAKYLGLGITLVHVRYPVYDPVSSVALNVHLARQDEKKLEALASQAMEEGLKFGLNTHISSRVDEGSITDSLTDLLHEKKFRMMIMGSKGIDTGIRRLFGTISSSVIRQGNKPVIVVPPHTEIKFPGKIVIGFTEELIFNNTIESILQFGAKNDVLFDFVHISDDKSGFKKLKDKLYERLMTQRDLLNGFNIKMIPSGDKQIHEVLLEYSHQVNAGMILLVTKHRNFIESLSHRSVTKRAVIQSDLPLMIIHPEAEIKDIDPGVVSPA